MRLDPMQSKKGKLPLASSALHPKFLELLAEVAEMSIEKGYRPLNWVLEDSPVTLMYCLNAAERHANKVKRGFDINSEEKTLQGLPTTNTPLHMAQVAYNYLMAAVLLLEHPDKDDRVFKDGQLKEEFSKGIVNKLRQRDDRRHYTMGGVGRNIGMSIKNAVQGDEYRQPIHRDFNGVAYTSHQNSINSPPYVSKFSKVTHLDSTPSTTGFNNTGRKGSLIRSGNEVHNVDFGSTDSIDLGGS